MKVCRSTACQRKWHFDPNVLDAFAKIARDLHDRYAGHEDADLTDELAAVATRYYSAGMETLSYGEGTDRA